MNTKNAETGEFSIGLRVLSGYLGEAHGRSKNGLKEIEMVTNKEEKYSDVNYMNAFYRYNVLKLLFSLIS